MEENYSTLHFEYGYDGKIERVFAMRDTKSMPLEKAIELSGKIRHAAEFTAFDPFN